MNDPKQTPEQWAIVELMGHVRLAGRLTEEERFGTKLGRIDIPATETCPDCKNGYALQRACEACAPPTGDGKGNVKIFVTQYFGGSAIYRLTPVTEETARRVARESQPAPVRQLHLPAPDDDDPRDDYDDAGNWRGDDD